MIWDHLMEAAKIIWQILFFCKYFEKAIMPINFNFNFNYQINLDPICRVNKSDGLLVCGLSASLRRSMCHRQQASIEGEAISTRIKQKFRTEIKFNLTLISTSPPKKGIWMDFSETGRRQNYQHQSPQD